VVRRPNTCGVKRLSKRGKSVGKKQYLKRE
jgi:hypothetical protein